MSTSTEIVFVIIFFFLPTTNFQAVNSSTTSRHFLVAMSTAYSVPSDVSPTTVKNTMSLLRIVALALISGAAISSRLFAVVNFESIIHELYVFSFFMCNRARFKHDY